MTRRSSNGSVAESLAELLPPFVAAGATVGCLFRGFDSSNGRAIAYVVAALVLAALLLHTPPSAVAWRRILPVIAAALAAFGWLLLVAGLGFGWAPDLLVARLLGWAAGLAWLLAGWCVGAQPRWCAPISTWLAAFLIAHVVVGAALWWVGSSDLLSWWSVSRQGRFVGTIGNANVTAAVASAGALLATGRAGAAWRARRTIASAGWAAAVLVGAAATAWAASRFQTLVLLTLLAALTRGIGTRLAALAAGALLAGAVLAPLTLLHERFDALVPGLLDRAALWRHSAELAAAHPVTGYGPGAFATISAHGLADPRSAAAFWTIKSAHDIVLQLLLVGGAPYLGLMALAAWRVSRPILIRVRSRPDPDDDAMLAAVSAILASGLVDIALDVPTSYGLALLLAGCLWSRAVAAGGGPPGEIHVIHPHREPA